MSVLAVFITAGVTYAQESLMANTCFPIEQASVRLKAASLKPDRRDTVDSFLEAHFVDVKKRSLPMNLYLKYDETRDGFVVSDSGEIEDFHTKVLGASSEAKICGPTQEGGKIGIVMSPSVRFKNRSGTHTMTEISDGVRDGKSHHKKNLGGAMALFVPKMTHIAIVYDEVETIPNVSAVINSLSVPVELEFYGEMLVIDVEALEDSDAESIIVGGGPYELFPVPSIKKMKSLGIK